MVEFDIVPTHLVVKAMRDNGYKNAAYAIAELVDNAIQAGSTTVEILCEEREETSHNRTRKVVNRIAVVDNGHGMDAEVLRKALQFGNGTRLKDRSGIGRFGMGLPNSSMSQAKRVEVWSWQQGQNNAMYSYLDLSEIEAGKLKEVPAPLRKPIPADWLRISATLATSKAGTIVVWSQLDKCEWKTAQAIFRNSEYTIGRVYRRFLHNGKARIRMASFVQNTSKPDFDEDVRPNDPMYLMENTSCPGWGTEAMFDRYGEDEVLTYTQGTESHEVRVRFSVAKPKARNGYNAGSRDYGKHARNNIGVSVVRADRELELQTAWCNQYDPRERWWGVEVEFPPALDEVFGVTNNKQSARALAEFAHLEVTQIAEREDYNTEQKLIEAWEKDNDPRLLLLKIKLKIESNLSTIRNAIKAQTANSQKRHTAPDSAEVIGTEAVSERKKGGNIGKSDKGETLPVPIRIQEIAADFRETGMDPKDATETANGIVKEGRKYDFYKANLDSPEFFTVRPRGGVLLIGLNTNHPAYDHLLTLLETPEDEDDIEALRKRMHKSYEGLKLLLAAWARYEDELPDGKRKDMAQEVRTDWGRLARAFFRQD